MKVFGLSLRNNLKLFGTEPALGCLSKLRSLDVNDKSQKTDKWFIEIIKQCCNLTELKNFGCKTLRTGNEMLKFIANHCPHLEVIDFCDTYHAVPVTDEGMEYIAKHCPQLRRVLLDGFPKITFASFNGFIENCTCI